MLNYGNELSQMELSGIVEYSNEDYVTRLLSKHEILNVNPNFEYFDNESVFITTPLKYNLGKYLSSVKDECGRFGNKYIFVK